MGSPFDAIDQAGQRAIAHRLGEPVVFTGRIVGDFSEKLDPARPAQTVTAIVSLSERSAEIAQGVEGRSKSGAKVNHQHDMIALTSADIASMPWLPKKNDLVCIEIEGLPVEFLIRSVRPHDHGSRSIWIHRKG